MHPCWLFSNSDITQGKAILSNGNVYEGLFVDGAGYKQGTLLYDDGQCSYTGEFLDNQFHGQSSLNFHKKKVHLLRAVGTFSNNHIIQGRTFFFDGNEYEGSFSDTSELTFKKGTLTLKWDDIQCTYTGEFLDNKFNGQGSLKWHPKLGQEADFNLHSGGGKFCKVSIVGMII